MTNLKPVVFKDNLFQVASDTDQIGPLNFSSFSNVRKVTIADHGFTVRQFVRETSTGWVLAQGNELSGATSPWMIVGIEGNELTLQKTGEVQFSTSPYLNDVTYYLSAGTAGGVSSFKPVGNPGLILGFYQPVFRAISANRIFLFGNDQPKADPVLARRTITSTTNNMLISGIELFHLRESNSGLHRSTGLVCRFRVGNAVLAVNYKFRILPDTGIASDSTGCKLAVFDATNSSSPTYFNQTGSSDLLIGPDSLNSGGLSGEFRLMPFHTSSLQYVNGVSVRGFASQGRGLLYETLGRVSFDHNAATLTLGIVCSDQITGDPNSYLEIARY